MGRGETVKEIRARLVYQVDRASVVNAMAANKALRDGLELLTDSWPKNMKRAVQSAFNDFVQSQKKLEAFEKAEARRKEAEEKRMTASASREEAIRFRDRVTFIDRYRAELVKAHARERSENARHLKDMERQEQQAFAKMSEMYARGPSARAKAPWLSASGFAGLTQGGGFGGLSFSGAGAPWMMAGMGAAAGMGRMASTERDSDYAVHRMMTLVGSDERKQGFGLEVMRNQAASLARELGVSIPEAADAMREALTNAISAGDASQFVKMANSLALLEGTDLNSSVQSLASIKNVYGMSGEQMKLVPDVLFAAVDKGNVKLTELASQIGQVGGMTKEAGIGFRELMAILAAATIKGMPGDVAATSARALGSAIITPTAKVKGWQESHGFTDMPEMVRMKGLTNVLLQMDEERIRDHKEWSDVLTDEIRARKILPYILEKEGKSIQQALKDQDDAKGRAAAANKEMMDTSAKQFAKAGETWSQIGQDLGRAWNWLMTAHMPGGHGIVNIPGGAVAGMGLMAGGIHRRAAYDEGNDANWADQMSGYRFGLSQLGSQENLRDYTWDAQSRKMVRKAGLEAPGANDNLPDWMKKDSGFYGLDKAANDVDAAKMDRSFHEEKAKEWATAIERAAKNYQKIKENYLPAIEHAQSAAASAATYWSAKLEKINELQNRVGESGFERRQAFGASLSGNTRTADMMRVFSRTKRNNYLASTATEPEEMAKYSAAASKEYGSLGGMDLESVGRRGFDQRELDSYVRSQIAQKGLKGKAAMDARRMLYDEAHGIERDVGKAYGKFQGLIGPDMGKGDFSKWYAEQGQGKMEGSLSSMLGGEKGEAKSKYEVAVAAHTKFRDLAEEIKAGWANIEVMVAKVKDDLLNIGQNNDVKALVNTFAVMMGSLRATGEKLQNGNVSDINNQALGFKPTGQLEGDLGDPRFKAPGGKGVVSQQIINHNNVDATVEMKFDPTGMDPATIAKLVANGLVPAVRTALDRGTGTLKSSK